jgi:hypothetical protein
MEQSLVWESNNRAAIQEIPGITWSPKFHHSVSMRRPPISAPTEAHQSAHILEIYIYIYIYVYIQRFNIIISSTRKSLKSSLPQCVLDHNCTKHNGPSSHKIVLASQTHTIKEYKNVNRKAANVYFNKLCISRNSSQLTLMQKFQTRLHQQDLIKLKPRGNELKLN